MIIYDTQVVEGMKDEDKKDILPVNIKEKLFQAHLLFNQLNEHNEDNHYLDTITEVEGRLNKLLLETLQVHPLVDLESYGFENIIEESTKYLFIPKEKQVEDYVVDVLVTFFKCRKESGELSVNLPFYLVTDKEQEVLIPMETDDENVVSVESLSIF